MSKLKWRRKLLTILNGLGTLFKRQRRRKQRAIANKISRIKLKLKKNRIL